MTSPGFVMSDRWPAQVRSLDAGSIQMTVVDGTVHLHGHLPSLAALQTTLEAAAAAPGVTDVESEIAVRVRENGSQ